MLSLFSFYFCNICFITLQNYRDIAGKEEWGRRFGRNQVYEVKRYADALD